MSIIEQQVSRTARQLLLNRWLRLLGRALVAGSAAFVLLTIVARAGGLVWPLRTIGLWIAAAVPIAAWVWALVTRESRGAAATRLDEAAGLRERISSGLHCAASDDPFAQAVREDAERHAAGLRVSRHIPLRWPKSLSAGTGAAVLAVLVFWLLPPMDLFGRQAAQQAAQSQQLEQLRRKEELKKQADRLKELRAKTPGLQDDAKLDETDLPAPEQLRTPEDVERERIKQIERMAEAVRQQREQPEHGAVEELKRMMRPLRPEEESDSPAAEVADALAQGDLEAGVERMQQIEEMLNDPAGQVTPEVRQQIRGEFLELGAKLEQAAANNRRIEDTLSGVGLSPDEAARVMEKLKGGDGGAMRDMLRRTLSQQQADKLAQEMLKQQAAQEMLKNLGQAMAGAAKTIPADALKAGQKCDFSAAADQLKKLAEQAAASGQLDEAMAQLSNMAKEARGQCPHGAKQGQCKSGSCSGGAGKPGSGSGKQGEGGTGLGSGIGKSGSGHAGHDVSGDPTVARLDRLQSHVPTTRGQVLGRFLVNGVQIRPESAEELRAVFVSAEKEAAEAIARDQVPLYARDLVRDYFTDADELLVEPPREANPPK